MVKVRHTSLEQTGNSAPGIQPSTPGARSCSTSYPSSARSQTPSLHQRTLPHISATHEKEHHISTVPNSRHFSVSSTYERRDPESNWGVTLIGTITPEGAPIDFQRSPEEISDDELKREKLRQRFRRHLRPRMSSARDECVIDLPEHSINNANTFTGTSQDSRTLQKALQSKLTPPDMRDRRSRSQMLQQRRGSKTLALKIAGGKDVSATIVQTILPRIIKFIC